MQVIWTKRAMRRLSASVNYGRVEFGEATAIRFYQRVRSYDSLLAVNPRLGKVEQFLVSNYAHQYRSLVVHPDFKLVYYINEKKETIMITNFFDTRQDPSKLTC